MDEPRKVDEQMDRYRFALEAAGVGVWDWEIRTGSVWWSDNLLAVHGIGADRFDGTFAGFLGLIFPDDREAVRRAIDEAVRTEADYEVEFRVLGDDGNLRWVGGKGRVFRDSAGKPTRMIGAGADLTARHRAADALRLLAAASGDLAGSLDPRATLANIVQSVVPSLADWCVLDLRAELGFERVAVVHRDPALADVAERVRRDYPPDPTAAGGVGLVLRTGEPAFYPSLTEEIALATARNDPEMLALLRTLGMESYVVVPLLAGEQNLGALSLIHGHSGRRHDAHDLAVASELARRAATALDNARLHAQAQAAIQQRDEFLAIVAHDLKSPLTVIQGRAQAIRRRLARADEIDAARLDAGLADVQATATRMARLIDELQDLAADHAERAPELRRQPADLIALVREEVALLAPTATAHQIRVTAPEEELVAEVDAHRLARALANLLGNAIKYSPEGGEISVEVGRDKSGMAIIAVRDDGLGIPTEDLPRIFDRYYRGTNVVGRISGSGIGLAGVKMIVEQHGGCIDATSHEGRGSTFTMRLPTVAQPPARLLDAAMIEPLHPAGGPIEPEKPDQAQDPGQSGPDS